MREEFDRQVRTLVDKGYPKLAGLPEDAFVDQLAPLAGRLPDAPFVVVVPGVPVAGAMALVELKGRPGFTTMAAEDLAGFRPTDAVAVPPGPAYLLVDPDPGEDTRNVTPDAALPSIVAAGRSPLTVEEGVAYVTQFPQVLRERACFSLLGSRCGDRRVTAVWVSGGRPRLGWCWAGNPHTWLGSASCAARVA